MKDLNWHKHFIWFKVIIDQHGRRVAVIFEEVWRRWVPGQGWQYDLID